MEAYRVEATISQDGMLTIRGVPFRAGDTVEVIILQRRKHEGAECRLLRGKPIRYVAPFDSVAEDEWSVLRTRSSSPA